jgi:hypothetical protein
MNKKRHKKYRGPQACSIFALLLQFFNSDKKGTQWMLHCVPVNGFVNIREIMLQQSA